MTVTISKIHKAFCEARGIKYNKKNVVKDLSWRCHEAATRLAEILTKEGTEARPVYGFWHGRCVGKDAPFYRHGWTVVDCTEIWDPTRWVFEGKKPYLFKGLLKDHPEYDEGMRRVRAETRSPFPKNSKSDRPSVQLNWSKDAEKFLLEILSGYSPNSLTPQQAMWICNYDYLGLGGFIDEIYSKFIEAGFGSFIPIDNVKWWESNKNKRA